MLYVFIEIGVSHGADSLNCYPKGMPLTNVGNHSEPASASAILTNVQLAEAPEEDKGYREGGDLVQCVQS